MTYMSRRVTLARLRGPEAVCVRTRLQCKRARGRSWVLTHAEASVRPVNLYRAAHVKLRQGEVIRLGRSSCGTCAGRVAPGALPEGAVLPLPLELRGLCKGA